MKLYKLRKFLFLFVIIILLYLSHFHHNNNLNYDLKNLTTSKSNMNTLPYCSPT